MELDGWQKEVLATDGNICLRSGRQVGKSTIIAIKACEYATHSPKKTILVIAAVERQAYLLFEKILAYLMDNYPKWICKGKDKPTRHIIRLNNKSTIHCLPTGLTGYGIRGYSVDLLIADEAAFIPEAVWTAVTPMLAVTRGSIWLLSTPHGKEGYYFRCFKDPAFKPFHISSLDCPRKDDKFLESERARMSKVEWAQEYLGEFIDELRQFFPDELIQSCMTLEVCTPTYTPFSAYSPARFLGVDVARMGEDETAFVAVEKGDKINMIDLQVTTKTFLTDTIDKIKLMDKISDFKKIYIDDGGIGSGVFDVLLRDEQTRRKVVAINNAARSLTRDNKRRKRLLKEDIYNNLLVLMESHAIRLFRDADLMLSLKSVQYEYLDNGDIRIFGNYTHICEALVRAAWGNAEKSLSIWVR